MPSFFESLRRIATGQAVFSEKGSTTTPALQQNQPSATPSGPKIFPTVRVVRSLCQNNGLGLECEVVIRNQSQQNIRLQRIEFLGLADELGEFLEPGGEREYTFNFAARPQDTARDRATLFFQTAPEGDYFCAEHLLEFEKLGDNTFTIHSFRFLPPIRDV
ncbi:MAG TPA: hypothetical protein VFT87_01190 [Candidatus Saccharimonadales bacterium]|nr:hypothetical protein [Candidatus Saccharimonadales bacterium]